MSLPPFASWNVRGFNNPLKVSMCKDLISSHNLKFLAILEAKIQPALAMDPWFSHCHKVFDNELCCDNFAFSNPGRIWLKWDSTAISFSPSFISSQVIHGLFSSGSSPPILLSVIYAANQPEERKLLWDNLLHISQNINLPWAVLGDFNCHRFDYEKAGGSSLSLGRLGELKNFIFNCGLQDLSSVGLLFTWYNQRVDLPIHIKLDRILVNSDFLDFFPTAHYKVDSPFGSDHSPIILLANSANRTFSRFLFKKFWLNLDGFWDVLLNVFNSPNLASPISAFYNCLKALKGKIKGMNWSSSNFLSNAILEAKSHQLQCLNALQSSPLDQGCNSNLNLANDRLNHLQMEWASWIAQRAKSYWLTQGEDDLGFLYAKIRSRANRNLIKKISSIRGTITGHHNIARELIEHFQTLFNATENFGNHSTSSPVGNMVPSSLTDSLVEPFSDMDIKAVVFAGKPDSAPGPDGFSFSFYQQAWHIIGYKVCSAVRHFFTTGVMPKGAKATAISLIPKGSHAVNISDFRPISLCNVFYKIVAKLIANRLKPILPHIIHISQAGFIAGRQSMDNIILANELLKVFRGSQKLFCAKLDIKKAFDSVSREFLLNRMKLKGFPDKFIDWIKGCISNVHFSICLNGSLEGFFSSSSGLRQGCPLSPLLFCIAMDGLSQRLHHSSFIGLNQGSFSINHLMYADDLLVFGVASHDNLNHLNSSLRLFSEESGLFINPTKSHIIFSKSVGNVDLLASILGSPSIENSLIYLGLPITYNRLSFAHFQPLLSRLSALLEGWKVRFLSFAGRVQFIKFTISNTLAYWIRGAIIPKACRKIISKLCSRFLFLVISMTRNCISFLGNLLLNLKIRVVLAFLLLTRCIMEFAVPLFGACIILKLFWVVFLKLDFFPLGNLPLWLLLNSGSWCVILLCKTRNFSVLRWRMAATSPCFGILGFAGILLGIIFLMLLWLVVRLWISFLMGLGFYLMPGLYISNGSCFPFLWWRLIVWTGLVLLSLPLKILPLNSMIIWMMLVGLNSFGIKRML
ncbi:putative mitochondrial protein [Dendrobium catenatum]|uniref:Putative mitochondrial protein n=1 Tax=Dendrobium catenatum TaxID=906689 RepID=A0A2I0V6X6_9ASPA|nr:putative mitochondrial protein [Dendrobium catenatum]